MRLEGTLIRILLDAHVHTNSSPDSSLTPGQLLEKLKTKGINAVAITDHDTLDGYRRVMDTKGFGDILVVPGIEVTTDLGDIIVLGITEPIVSRDAFEVADRARGAGGIIVAPHPFDWKRASLGEKSAMLGVDLIEGVNGKCSREENQQAKEFAKAIGAPVVGGSDAHEKAQVGTVVNVIECEKDLDSLLAALRKGAKAIIRLGERA
ncbi:MAG: PHP domain-containing protein [Candidatus Methanosuratincola sp.]|jgi:predicted metal-dependent phosphoesterase TrpH|nr:PHP domain-containing protein [Candidatus Methanosuratincola sp.]